MIIVIIATLLLLLPPAGHEERELPQGATELGVECCGILLCVRKFTHPRAWSIDLWDNPLNPKTLNPPRTLKRCLGLGLGIFLHMGREVFRISLCNAQPYLAKQHFWHSACASVGPEQVEIVFALWGI